MIMLFGNPAGVWSYEVIREAEETTLRINCEQYHKIPSLEDDPITMARLIDKLTEIKEITKIIFSQKREYEYDYPQLVLLMEIAQLQNQLVKQKNLFSYEALSQPPCARYANNWYTQLQNILYHLLKSDPIGAYVELKRLIRESNIEQMKAGVGDAKTCMLRYMKLLQYLSGMLEKTKLIILAEPYLAGYQVGDREVYRKLFHASVKPDFMYAKLMATYPADGKELASYEVDNTEVIIFSIPDTVQYLYHIMPPEFKLSEEKYELLDMARKVMSEHQPKQSDFVDPSRMRQVFENIGSDLIEELAEKKGIRLRAKEVEELTKILIRYTVGFGLVEVLLQDDKIQDISLNSPMGQAPVYIVHQDFDDCKTNIIPTTSEAESWAGKLRMISGRPLDEANPILDTELELPGASVRVAAVTKPLDPTGLAFSFRRHRDKPWTLPLFIKAKMITPLSAGLISFLIDGTRSMLICGTRSSGKSSFLSSMLIEIMRRYRIITIEDTLELPTGSMRRLGFNIQSLKVASALSQRGSELSAEDGIRSTLRLGDSALIVGEVRSTEAKALYEAMRVGAAANVVAGTIHGDSPYGIYDRVVNDIGVPKTSFKATDICIIANPVRSADGLHKWRRVTQITEVGKKWENDPLLEGAFVDLMKYDARTDMLEPTDALINGESEILKTVAGNIKDFAGSWDAVWENILLRAKTKETLTNTAIKLKNDDLLEAPFVIQCNDQFHMISEKVKEEVGTLDPKRIYFEWEEWFKRTVKKGEFVRVT
ncbi:type II/IV secretion system ATPase subunit [Candidatus Woesearchaeota archaeon]|nr:type II/IV secretion system ATPase subunit [Candidatus Woesearchaeota archaeon]